MCACKSSYDGAPCKCGDKSKDSFGGEDVKTFIINNKIVIAVVVIAIGIAIYYFKFRK